MAYFRDLRLMRDSPHDALFAQVLVVAYADKATVTYGTTMACRQALLVASALEDMLSARTIYATTWPALSS